MSQRKLKFAPDADYDSDPECIKKEKVQMLSDLTQSINKFSRGNPLTLIENLGQDRWNSHPTRDPCQPHRDCIVEEAAANKDQR